MVRIGLTGGIASGKTLVADELARLGAVVIDADVLARAVVEPGTAALAAIKDRFGGEVLLADGSLNRPLLGEMVFGDRTARADLNAIIHPKVRAQARRLEELSPEGAVVVHVIPLLVETGQQNSFDGVMVVDVPVELQIQRLMARNDLTLRQAQERVNSQALRSARLAAADWVIDNSGAPEASLQRVRDLWDGPLTRMRGADPT